MANSKSDSARIDHTTKVRTLNDAFRRTLTGGALVVTAGVVALGAKLQQRVISAVRTFDCFDHDNDSWGEHDFGSLDVDGTRVFFKFDYYDLQRAMHSPNPADPAVTERVLTIMLAEEY